MATRDLMEIAAGRRAGIGYGPNSMVDSFYGVVTKMSSPSKPVQTYGKCRSLINAARRSGRRKDAGDTGDTWGRRLAETSIREPLGGGLCMGTSPTVPAVLAGGMGWIM